MFLCFFCGLKCDICENIGRSKKYLAVFNQDTCGHSGSGPQIFGLQTGADDDKLWTAQTGPWIKRGFLSGRYGGYKNEVFF